MVKIVDCFDVGVVDNIHSYCDDENVFPKNAFSKIPFQMVFEMEESAVVTAAPQSTDVSTDVGRRTRFFGGHVQKKSPSRWFSRWRSLRW